MPTKRILSAPLLPTPFGRAVRAHELAHVKFSPPQVRPKQLGVQLETLMAVEDARVNECARRAGLGHVFGYLDDAASGFIDPRDDFRIASLLLVAAHGTGAFPRLWTAYDACGDAGQRARAVAGRALALLQQGREGPSFRHGVKVMRLLDRMLGPSDGKRTPFLCAGCVTDEEDDRPIRRGRRGLDRQDLTWGLVRAIEEPPRLVPSSAALWTRRSTDEGAVFRSPHRWLVDGRVFLRRRRLAGGTVLIDGSGSTRFNCEAIIGFLSVSPGATVARYDGEEDYGIIRILARHGTRVADELLDASCCGRGNIIDGPALEWLATQPAPRVWVTDGGVTGVGDEASEALREEASTLCQQYGITEVKDAAGVRLAMGGASAPARRWHLPRAG